MKIGNTFTRIIVALLAIPLVLAVCYYGRYYFLAFTLGIGAIAYFEYSRMVLNKKTVASMFIGLASVLFIIINTYFSFIPFYHLFLLIVLSLTFAELFRNKGSAIHNVGTALFGILYLGLFSSSILGIREYFAAENYVTGGYLIISILVTIWVCDSAAFFVGTAIGKNKLFPRVSPNKSWEGAIAGFLFSIAAMLLAKWFVLDNLSWFDAAVIGLLVGIFGQIGDLIESLIKRDTGVKDSSNILPGHGGIFDRFDSLLYSAPIIFLYLEFSVSGF